MKRVLDSDRGMAAVEFGLVLPLLMLIFGGIVEFGRMVQHHHAVEKSVYAAARYLARQSDTGQTSGACSAADGSGAALVARNLVLYGKPTGGTPLLSYWNDPNGVCIEGPISQTVTDGGGNSFTVDKVRVTATVTYQDLGLLGFVGLDNIQMVARHEEAITGE